MAKSKNYSGVIGTRLFKDDFRTLKRHIDSGKYKDKSDAIREVVSAHLTTIRLQNIGHDMTDKTIRNSQWKVIAPLKNQLDEVENQIGSMNSQINDLTSAVRTYTESFKKEDTNDETDLNIKSIEAKINRLLENSEENLKLTDIVLKESNKTRESLILQRGIMTFFTLGYQADKIKPVQIIGEKGFSDLIEKISIQLLNDFKKNNSEDKTIDENILIRQFVQRLIEALYAVK